MPSHQDQTHHQHDANNPAKPKHHKPHWSKSFRHQVGRPANLAWIHLSTHRFSARYDASSNASNHVINRTWT